METSKQSDSSGRGRRSKVARLIEEYGLDGIGTELEERWTAEENRSSLRDLATYFNQMLLKEALGSANLQPLDGEVENVYRLLTDDGISRAEYTRVRRRLERDGVDVTSVEDDFVTYQAIRTYLKEYRNAEYSPAEVDPIEREKTNVQQFRGRVVSVTERNLERLRSNSHLDLGEFRMLVDIEVICEACNSQYEIIDLLERGGCRCGDTNEQTEE